LPDLKDYSDQNSVIDQSADSVPIEDPQVKGKLFNNNIIFYAKLNHLIYSR